MSLIKLVLSLTAITLLAVEAHAAGALVSPAEDARASAASRCTVVAAGPALVSQQAAAR